MDDGMELAKQLMRSCMRTFYDTKHILVIDALMFHSAVRDDDLSYLMGINTKDLHKLCGRLKEDRFLAVHTRSEYKDGQQRPLNRTYYYIDYRATIDAIKWRVYSIDKLIQGTTVPQDERKEYSCPRCKSKWTVMEVLTQMRPSGFECPKCAFVGLIHDTGENETGHEQSTKLNAQFKFITNLLPKIDAAVIPENTFDQAFNNAVPVERDATNPAYETAPVSTSLNKPTAVKGLVDTGPTHIAVSFTDGPTDADKAAEQARKEKHAQQNAMPMHFTHSTVTGEKVKFEANSAVPTSQALAADKKGPDISVVDNDPGIEDYFAQIRAEAARAAEQERIEEEDSDDEEEEDFEDVPTGTGSGVATPAISVSAVASSGGGDADVDAGEGVRKRIKREEDENEVKVKIEKDEESDEDIEFEDV